MNSSSADSDEEVVVVGKKRKSNPLKWKRNVRKMEKLKGNEHTDCKGCLVPAKTTTGPPCG